MKRIALIALCIVMLMSLGLLTGCKKDADVTPPEDTPVSESPSAPDSPTPSIAPPVSTPPEVSDSPQIPDASPSEDPPNTILDMPDRTPDPNLNWEYIEFPDLVGFEKAVVDVEAMVIYSNGLVNIIMQYISATQEQLDELVQGGGEAFDPMLEEVLGTAEITSSKMIDLPGLNRQGLELEFMLQDLWFCRGLFIPSEGQVLAVFGMAMPNDKQVLLDGYNQIIDLLKLTI